jgi:deoxyribonuclease-4
MAERLIGAHLSTAGGMQNALYRGKEAGCTVVQIFTASPRQWKSSPLKEETPDAFNKARAETGIDCVIAHDSYLINMAASDEGLIGRSQGAFIEEMERCHALGIPYAVTHMGAHVDNSFEAGMANAAASLKKLLEIGPKDVHITLETTAGQGTGIGYRFEQIAELIVMAGGNDRLAVCIDTCHIFAAGYDLRTPETYNDTMAQFDKLIGFNRLRVIHANDSLKPLGSRVDRHATPGEGQLGLEAFRLLLNDPRLTHIPIIIEEPDDTKIAADVARLRKLAK